jgi:hypothetical protein
MHTIEIPSRTGLAYASIAFNCSDSYSGMRFRHDNDDTFAVLEFAPSAGARMELESSSIKLNTRYEVLCSLAILLDKPQPIYTYTDAKYAIRKEGKPAGNADNAG